MHWAPSTVYNIATFKMAAVLPTRAKRTNKGRFCRAKAFIRHNDATDRLKASWLAIEKHLHFFNVHIMKVDYAKFHKNFDSRTISRELP